MIIDTHNTRHSASKNFYIKYSPLHKLNTSWNKKWYYIPLNFRELENFVFFLSLRNYIGCPIEHAFFPDSDYEVQVQLIHLLLIQFMDNQQDWPCVDFLFYLLLLFR